jgi:lipopolysaccharide heptosyltransferase II
MLTAFVRIPTLLAIWWLRFRQERSATGHKEPTSIIIFRLDSMGDVVLTTPLFRALKQTKPHSRCTVVVQAAYRSLLVTNPYVDEVLPMPQLNWQWLPLGFNRLLDALLLYWTVLRTHCFDIAISPRWGADEHLATMLCVLTNAATRVGYSCHTSGLKEKLNRDFDAAYNICLPPGPVQHEVERNLAVAEALGRPLHDRRLDIRISETDRREARKHLAGTPRGVKLIALGIGAASVGRRWPTGRYAETLERLSQAHAVWPVIICGREDLGEARGLQTLLQKRASVVSGLPLREVCAVLERCDLFIGNDSGCAHLAAAMGCRTLVISRHPLAGDPNHFNSPVRFAPWGAQGSVVQPLGRDSCEEACTVPAMPHCILNVNVADVVSEAVRLLDLSAPSDARPQSSQRPGRLIPVNVREVVEAECTT